jgi:hypothetical protein
LELFFIEIDDMLVQEILDKKIKYDVVKQNSTLFITRSTIGGRVITFTALIDDDSAGCWEIAFSENQIDALPHHRTFGTTGSGNELEVFSMVKDSILEFVSRYNPVKFYFTADKPVERGGSNNRANLYDRLIKRFKIDGYSNDREAEEHHDSFSFTRNQ